MNRCPITYELCGGKLYSEKGLRLLSRSLKELKPFPYSPAEQIDLAKQMADKLSIQGVQPKLSVVLSVQQNCFVPVENKGKYILKPPQLGVDDLPQNEDLTMRLAASVGIDIPLHGLIYNKDESFTYFIKRFDRHGRNGKYHVEDFSQLLGFEREIKYEGSIEQLIYKIDKHCTVPFYEKEKLFRLALFCFLVGNEDMHLKNFSLYTKDNLVTLSPAYDLINSTLAGYNKEEMALTLNGKKSNFKKKDLVEYLGSERLKLSIVQINKVLEELFEAREKWKTLINISFLKENHKEEYFQLYSSRFERLFG